MQSPTERHEAAERVAYCRMVEEGASRDCRLLEVLEQGKALFLSGFALFQCIEALSMHYKLFRHSIMISELKYRNCKDC